MAFTSTTGLPVSDLASPVVSPVEKGFRRGLWVASALAAIVLLCYVATMLWASNELSPPESVVAAQSLMLAHDGTLYYDLKHYPFTVCAYMPSFYWLESGLIRAGFSAVHAGRWISFAALLGLIALCGRIALLYTGDRNAAWVAALAAASSSLLGAWGTTGQVDTLAAFFALAAFYHYSRFHVRGESSLWIAGLCAALALFTKQTMVAAPTAIFVLLLMRDRKKALWFGAIFAAGVGAAVLAINAALDGRFLTDTVLREHESSSAARSFCCSRATLFRSRSGLLMIVAVSFGRMRRGHALAPSVYLIMATLVFLGTAAKIGSDTNYQIESTLLAGGMRSHRPASGQFFRALLCTQQELDHTTSDPPGSAYRDRLPCFRQYLAGPADEGEAFPGRDRTAKALRTAIGRAGSLHRLQRHDAIAPAFGRRAAHLHPAGIGSCDRSRAGPPGSRARRVFDRHPERRRVSAASNSAMRRSERLPPSQLDEVRKHYRLVQHVPGPFLDALCVPAGSGEDSWNEGGHHSRPGGISQHSISVRSAPGGRVAGHRALSAAVGGSVAAAARTGSRLRRVHARDPCVFQVGAGSESGAGRALGPFGEGAVSIRARSLGDSGCESRAPCSRPIFWNTSRWKTARRFWRRSSASFGPGGRFIAIQPNFRLEPRRYFDDYTHRTAYTDAGFQDFLRSLGWRVEHAEPRFTPFTMKSRIPTAEWLVSLYLALPYRPWRASSWWLPVVKAC